MRKFSLFLALLAVLLQATARERSLDEKKNLAISVLQKSFSRSAQKTSSVETMIVLQESRTFTIIGYPSGGFAVISNDDSNAPILGYSLTGNIDHAPLAFKWWQQQIEQTMLYMERDGVAYIPSYTTQTPVSPIMKSTWDQGVPYNNQCPVIGGGYSGNYVTGCVATAMAQIMYYHQYPTKGAGSNSYPFTNEGGTVTTLKADFGNTTYDWGNMIDNYAAGYSEAQANAVATLMSHCGISVNMSYTVTGSGAYTYNAAKALSDNFCYNKNIRYYSRDYFDTDEWMNLIYQDLAQNLPILYSGVDNQYGGHAFVVDGCDEKGLVHVNWGWNGEADGFFDIQALNPQKYKFNYGQSMLLGIDPYKTYTYETFTVGQNFTATRKSSSLLSVTGTIYNMATRPFTGKMGVILISENGSVRELYTFDCENVETNNGFSLGSGAQQIMASLIPAGTYRLVLAAKSSEETKWKTVRMANGEVYEYTFVKTAKDYSMTAKTAEHTTGISTISMSSATSPRIFDLQGREVKTPQKGIYIINGKKVVK